MAHGLIELASAIRKTCGSKSVIYLASPYTKYFAGHAVAFNHAVNFVGELNRLGIYVYSPIVHTHPTTQITQRGIDWQQWQEFDKLMIDRCDGLVVLQLRGWEESVGVTAEIDYAKSISKPCWHLAVRYDDAGELPMRVL